jgi:hypothetical protein
LNAAMELLLTQPDIDDNETENETKTLPAFYSHNGSFKSFREFRQQYFQPNPLVNSFQSIQKKSCSSFRQLNPWKKWVLIVMI